MINKILFIFLFSFLSAAAFDWPTYIFKDDFETGYWYKFGAQYTPTPTMETDTVHSGNYALVVTPEDDFRGDIHSRNIRIVGGDGLHKARVRAWFYLCSDYTVTSGYPSTIVGLIKEGVGSIWAARVINSGGNLKMYSSPAVGTGATTITKDVWHCVEMYVDTGSGDGVLQIYLDGNLELSSSTRTVTALCDQVGISPSASYSFGRMFIDDIYVDTLTPSYDTVDIDLMLPELAGRTGAPWKIVGYGYDPSDKITLTIKKEVLDTIYEDSGSVPLSIDSVISISNFESGVYNLIATLYKDNGTIRKSDTVTFNKKYDGNNRFTIDEHNNIIKAGSKFFPITSYIISYTNMRIWADSGYCNTFLGTSGWDVDVSPENFAAFTDSVGLRGYDNSGPILVGPHLGVEHPDSVRKYVEAVINKPNVSFWQIGEEYVYKQHNGDFAKEIWDSLQFMDSSRICHMEFMTDPVEPYRPNNFYYSSAYQEFCYPYLCFDFYGTMIYPFEYTTKDTVHEITKIAHYMDALNHSFVPKSMFIQTTDCKPGEGGGYPTATAVKGMAWLSVIAGFKMVQWYHYQATTPDSHFVVMKNFVSDVEKLTEAILGNDVTFSVSVNSDSIAAMTKSYNDTTFIFAANRHPITKTVDLTIGSLPENEVTTEYFSEESVDLSGNAITTEFTPYEVKIFKQYSLGSTNRYKRMVWQ